MLCIVNTQMTVDLRPALQEQGQDPLRLRWSPSAARGRSMPAGLARAPKIPRMLVPPYPV